MRVTNELRNCSGTSGAPSGGSRGEMLLQKELAALLGLLSDDTRAIEAVGAMFVRTFAKADHFRVATALWCASLSSAP